MSYGTSTAESYHQLGNYAGKILSGLKPSDLPTANAHARLARRNRDAPALLPARFYTTKTHRRH
jgi:hypothetical protein